MDSNASNKEVDNISKDVDVIELARNVWANKKFVFKVCGIAAVVSIILAFSFPKEYETKVVLVPETTQKNALGGGGMGALAAMAGFNLGGAASEDAIYPELYPEIITSTPFLVDLLKMKVTTDDGELTTTLYDYIDEHQKGSWIGFVISSPFRLLGWIMSLFREKEESNDDIDVFRLTLPQERIAKKVEKSISAEVDGKTGMLYIAVRMQDPLISASVADTVTINLQNYITNYRTNKARQDLIFTEQLYNEAKNEFYTKQEAYTEYTDFNLNIVSARYKAELDRKKNDMDLAYNVYSQMAQQLQLARGKVQEITPVYTILQPVTVPAKAAFPNKPLILICCVFFAFLGCVAWIGYKNMKK